MPVCLNCKKPVTVKYCNNTCQQSYQWQLVKTKIEQTGIFPKTINGKPAKRYLIEKHGHVCAICALKEWNGHKMPLILDHIDGNAENWLVENIRHICPNCDALTPTFKARNKGNGRYGRRQRYAAGQSY